MDVDPLESTHFVRLDRPVKATKGRRQTLSPRLLTLLAVIRARRGWLGDAKTSGRRLSLPTGRMGRTDGRTDGLSVCLSVSRTGRSSWDRWLAHRRAEQRTPSTGRRHSRQSTRTGYCVTLQARDDDIRVTLQAQDIASHSKHRISRHTPSTGYRVTLKVRDDDTRVTLQASSFCRNWLHRKFPKVH